MTEAFSADVQDKLGWYVYRLIDPRNGQTFYVGKGKGNRVFAHARGLVADALTNGGSSDEDAESLKIQTLREIARAGLAPLHVIHRHGLETEDTAYHVEAALIDAYPGLSNAVGGHGNGEFGCRHVDEIIRIYAAEPLVAYEDLILIYIGRAQDEGRDVFQSVQAAWRMSKAEAEKRKLVLAYDGGIICGAYRPTEWLDAKQIYFPHLPHDIDGRIGFKGNRAEDDVWHLYVGKRAPKRKRGAQTPFSYISKGTLD